MDHVTVRRSQFEFFGHSVGTIVWKNSTSSKCFFFLDYSVGNSVDFRWFFSSELMNKWKFLISIETQLIQWFGMISEESRGHVIFMIYFHLLYWCSSSNPCVIIIILISNYHLNDYFSIFFLYIKRLWLPFKSEEIE